MELTEQTAKRRSFAPYVIGVLALSVLSLLLRIANLFFFFDSYIGYYRMGALLPIVESVLIGLLFAAMAILPRFLFRDAEPFAFPARAPLGVRVAAAFCALAFLWLAYLDLSAGASILLLVASLLGSLYFLLYLGTGVLPPLVRSLMGLGVIVRLMAAVVNAYFDQTVQMNAPEKLYFLLGCLGGMLLVISELRAFVAKIRPASYLFRLGAACLLLGVSSIPALYATLADILETDRWLSLYVVQALLFLYAVVRLCVLAIAAPDEETDKADEGEGENAAEKTDVAKESEEVEEAEDTDKPEAAEADEEVDLSEQAEAAKEAETTPEDAE